MAHTPGPWKISEFDGQHYISDANGKVVAEAILCDEQEDNACLIAASTDLLEACNSALEMICAGAEAWMQAECEAKLRAVIAKAKPQ